jgi:hypothetical protein
MARIRINSLGPNNVLAPLLHSVREVHPIHLDITF